MSTLAANLPHLIHASRATQSLLRRAQPWQALRTLTKGRTTLVIAHRLSTVVDADRIVVLRAGRVDAVGPHAELLAQGGYYARLFNRDATSVLAGDCE